MFLMGIPKMKKQPFGNCMISEAGIMTNRYTRIRAASLIAMGCFLFGFSVALAADTPADGDKSSFSGVVSSYNKASGQVTIEYGRGDEKETVTVQIGEKTRMLGQDLADGSVVTMRGEFEKGKWQATIGVVKPTKPRFDTTVGTVVGVSGDMLTVIDKDGKKQEYKVPEGTSIQEGQVLVGVVSGDGEDTKGPRLTKRPQKDSAAKDAPKSATKLSTGSTGGTAAKTISGFTTASAIEKRLKKAIDPDELDKAVAKGAKPVRQPNEYQGTGRASNSPKHKRAAAVVCGALNTVDHAADSDAPALCLADEEIHERISGIDKQILLDEEKLKVKAQGLGGNNDTTWLECRTQDKQGLGSDDEACWIAQEQRAREYKDAASKLEILRDKKEQFIQEQVLRNKDAAKDLNDQDKRDESQKRVLDRTTDIFKRFSEMKASLLGKAGETKEQVGSNFKTLVKSRASDVLKEKKDFEDVAKGLVEKQDKEKVKRVASKENVQKDRLVLEQDLEKAKERKYQATEERNLADRKLADQKRMVGGMDDAKTNLKALQEKDPEGFAKLQREFPTQSKEGINLPALVRSSFEKYGTMDLGKMMSGEAPFSAEKRDEQKAREIKSIMGKSDSSGKAGELQSKEKEIEGQKKPAAKAQALQKIPLDKLKSLGIAGKNLTRIKKDFEKTVTASAERIDKQKEEKRALQDSTRKQYADVRSKVDFNETKKTIVAAEKERTLLRQKQRVDAVTKGGDATKFPSIDERKPSTGRVDAVKGTTGQQSPVTKEAPSKIRSTPDGTDVEKVGRVLRR
jgi:hypothetical protein